MTDNVKLTKKRLVEVYNTIAAEPVKSFKTVKEAEAKVQAVLDEYDATDIGSIPEDIRTELDVAGFTLVETAEPEEVKKPKRKRGEWLSHCHQRVYQAMIDNGNEWRTKAEIAELTASINPNGKPTTIAVVANAFHDFKRAQYTPEGVEAIKVPMRRKDGVTQYRLGLDDTEESAELSKEEQELQEQLVA